MQTRIRIEKMFLRIPVRIRGKEKALWIRRGAETVFQCMVSLFTQEDPGNCDYQAELPVERWMGEELTVTVEDCAPVLFEQSDEQLPPVAEGRPLIHFAPRSGWMNDPCGLCFYKGKYHLYFQHNMFGTHWNNMSWGHAVSEDLLHWRQQPEALLPDQNGAVFTGSALPGSAGMLGDLQVPEDAMLFFYTSAGDTSCWSRGGSFTQRIAWTTDGSHFERLERPAVDKIIYQNRDPKVYRNEEAGNWYMVLFLDGHEYAILVSEDLRNWEMTQKLTVREGWECPDLVLLAVRGSGEKKWLFWTPDGAYLVGSFDGRLFHAEQSAKCLYAAADRRVYAAQTFAGIPDRVVQLQWLITHERHDDIFCCMNGAPRELELLPGEDGYTLAAHLSREVYEQECRILERKAEHEELALEWEEDGAALIRLDQTGGESFEMNACGARIVWNAEEKKLVFPSMIRQEPEEITDITILADRGIVEISVNEDTLCFYLDTNGQLTKKLNYSGSGHIRIGVIR